MKKLLYFSLAVLTIISCKDKDEKKDPIEGTWLPVTEVYANCDDEAEEGIINYDDEGCTDNYCVELTFKGGNLTVLDKDGSETETEVYTYTTSGSTIALKTDGFERTATYAISDNNLTLTFEEDESGCSVVVTYKRK